VAVLYQTCYWHDLSIARLKTKREYAPESYWMRPCMLFWERIWWNFGIWIYILDKVCVDSICWMFRENLKTIYNHSNEAKNKWQTQFSLTLSIFLIKKKKKLTLDCIMALSLDERS
jgi:hypothetical protein